MPRRSIPLIENEYYHVFNRSTNKEPIFVRKIDCRRALNTIKYYQFSNLPVRLSYFLSYGSDKKGEIWNSLSNGPRNVEIVCYCLMPNHYHLLVKQVAGGGLSKFVSLFQNSYTKYINKKYMRSGHLFGGQFKAVRVEDDNQLLHLSRYIHLNPYTSFVVRTLNELNNYDYSSLSEYVKKGSGICSKEIVFSNFSTPSAYKKFVFDQSGYQRRLAVIKHFTFE